MKSIVRSRMASHTKSYRTFQYCREIADISITAVFSDPVVAGPVKHGKRCYSRYVYLPWCPSRGIPENRCVLREPLDRPTATNPDPPDVRAVPGGGGGTGQSLYIDRVQNRMGVVGDQAE
jgi:hypothetical protein